MWISVSYICAYPTVRYANGSVSRANTELNLLQRPPSEAPYGFFIALTKIHKSFTFSPKFREKTMQKGCQKMPM
jgi:hypothetical protein